MAGIKPQLADIVLTRIICATFSQVSINNLHWYVGGITTGGATLQEIATALDATWAAPFKAMIGSGATYRGTGAQNIMPVPTIEFIGTAGAGAGGGSATLLPTQTSMPISYKAFNGGPRFRGRIYMPFPGSTWLTTGGAPSAAYLALGTTLIAAIGLTQTIVGVGGTTTLNLAIRHKGTFTVALASMLYLSAKFGTQRRRGQYGRMNTPPW